MGELKSLLLSKARLVGGCYRLVVKAKPKSRKEGIFELDDGTIEVHVKSQAQEGKANDSIIAIVASALEIPKRYVEISRGETAKIKEISIRKLD